jgi:hypothetical protein
VQALQEVIEGALLEVSRAEKGVAGLDLAQDWAKALETMPRKRRPSATDTMTCRVDGRCQGRTARPVALRGQVWLRAVRRSMQPTAYCGGDDRGCLEGLCG